MFEVSCKWDVCKGMDMMVEEFEWGVWKGVGVVRVGVGGS